MNHNQPSVNTGRPQYSSALQGPFYNANNILMFYGGGNRGLIAESIIQAVRDREPILHIHGEPGSGKTMMSLVVSDRIKHRFRTIRYDLREVTAAKLMRHLLIELAPQHSELISAQQAQEGAEWSIIETAIDQLKEHLTQLCHTAYSKPYAFIIDSNDSLDEESSRVIERLSRFEIDYEVAMHCIVFHRCEENTQRCSADSDSPYRSDNHFWLRRLNYGEISEYLRHHMMLFDFNRRDLFTQEMAYFIAEQSGGVFKSINTLARNAFALANLGDDDKSSMSHLISVGFEKEDEQPKTSEVLQNYHTAAYTLLGFGVVICSTAILFLAH